MERIPKIHLEKVYIAGLRTAEGVEIGGFRYFAIRAGEKEGGKIAKEAGKGKSPVFTVSREQYPNHAKMLENAQEKGHSLEGLERGSGTRAAQKEIRKQQGPPPEGHDYDEFPYASTKQGGAGSYVEPVPSEENQAVGRELGKFYREQGIKENDKFDIKITD